MKRDKLQQAVKNEKKNYKRFTNKLIPLSQRKMDEFLELYDFPKLNQIECSSYNNSANILQIDQILLQFV